MANEELVNGHHDASSSSNGGSHLFNGSAAAALEKGVPIGVAMSADGEISYRTKTYHEEPSYDGESTTSGQPHFGGNMGAGLPDFFSQEVCPYVHLSELDAFLWTIFAIILMLTLLDLQCRPAQPHHLPPAAQVQPVALLRREHGVLGEGAPINCFGSPKTV